MKASVFYLIPLLLLVSGCHKQPNYNWEAKTKCDAVGYNYDSAVLADCIEYAQHYMPQIDSNQKYPTFSEFLCEKEGINIDADNYNACIKEKSISIDEFNKKAAKHLADMKRQAAENAKRAERERKEAERKHREAMAMLIA